MKKFKMYGGGGPGPGPLLAPPSLRPLLDGLEISKQPCF